MAIRTIHAQESLDVIWEELVYTEATMVAEPLARGFAPVVTALLARLELTQAAQKQAWRAEIVAQAHVDRVDASLDDEVTLFWLDLTRAERGDKHSPRIKLYFNGTLSELVRLGLESELKRVEPWPAALAGEPEANIKAHGPVFTSLTAEGKAALAARTTAAVTRATQRVRDINSLVDDVNAARLSISGKLSQVAADNHLPKDFPDRFFRHAQRTAKPAAEAPAVTPAPTK